MHRQVLAELLDEPDWLETPATQRSERLSRVLADEPGPAPTPTSDQARSTLRVFDAIRKRVTVETVTYGTHASGRPADPTIIDADYEDLDPPKSTGPSGWTRH